MTESAASPIQKIETRLHAITWEAQGIHSFELRRADGGALPAFAAGSHIDLYLGNGMVRSYSLVNPQGETHRYVVGINRDVASRGGSRYVHDNVKVGDKLTISAPRNNFPLAEDAPHSVFIAGGIGITPMYCMMQRMAELRASWQLFYSARTPLHAAYRGGIEALGRSSGQQVVFNYDQVPGGKMLDLKSIVAGVAPTAHLYCCGPLPMLAAFEEACQGRAEGTVHVEYFSAREEAATGGGFNVVMSRSGKTVFVPEGKTILDALLDAGENAPYSCMEGVCGTCETKVISGTPDHRDMILTESERKAGKTMMICCSGSKSGELVLDL
ncbi:MAG: ferredoxin [Betaproteobacteria bacterium RIFCSPLOWO2_02_FULL_62_17]|nr:MAG: ferredoxin [Betaproteobacteria bacterium RIFCSPLOWO2_02_FULL_62_17]